MNTSKYRRFVRFALVGVAVLVGTVGSIVVVNPTAASAASGTVSGVVYRDWNYDGTTTDRFATVFTTPSSYLGSRNWPESYWNSWTLPISDGTKYDPHYLRSQEPGEPGITIIVTDAAGTQWTTTSGSDGMFSISVPTASTSAVRVEMSIPASKSFLVDGPKGARSGGNVQFVTLGTDSTGRYFSVANPTDYCQHDSSAVLRLVTPCWKFGDQKWSTPRAVLNSLPFDTPHSTFTSPPGVVSEATENQIGTTYGLAWDPYRKNLFASAFMRRHAGFGPAGTGAIYKIADPGTGAKAATIYANLNALLGAGTAGNDTHPTGVAGCSGDRVFNPAVRAGAITACEASWMYDVASYDVVGKSSLGDMDISADGSYLYVVNMFDKKVYRMSARVAPTTSADLASLAIPAAASGTGYKCAAADSRPMAVTIHDGVGYVGVVCSQESGAGVSDPRGYVYAFDPIAMSFTAAPVAQFKWDQPSANYRNGAASYTAWSSSWVAQTNTGDGPHEHSAQPIIASIAFDDQDMLIGVRNRFHDQIGQSAFDLSGSSTTRTSPSSYDGGNIVRACPSGGRWAVEGNTVDSPTFNEFTCTGGYNPIYVPGSGPCDALGGGSAYNVVTQGNFTGSNTEAEGRVAVGGNASFSAYSVAPNMTNDASRVDLAVAGNLTYINGSVQHGAVRYGGSLSTSGYSSFGTTASAAQPWIATTFSTIASTSAAWGALATTAAYQTPSADIIRFEGTNATLNVFSITAATLQTAGAVQLRAPTGAVILINVTGASFSTAVRSMYAVQMWDGSSYVQYSHPTSDSNANNYRSRTFWNFPSATTVQIGPGLAFEGSVVAPNADVRYAGGQANGGAYVKSIDQTNGGEIHWYQPMPPACTNPPSIVPGNNWWGATTTYGTKSLFSTTTQSTQGAVVMLQGSQSRRADLYGALHNDLSGGKLIATAGDPNGASWANGIASVSPQYGWDLANGATSATGYTGTDGSNYAIYQAAGYSDADVQPTDFGKANGLGDLEVLCTFAPIDIGDLVWRDNNSDGTQNAGEPGIANVTVRLMQGAAVLGTATTDANGNYLFSSRTGTSTANTIYGVPNLKPGQNGFYVKVDTADTDLPAGFHIATKGVGSNGRVDSDGLADGGTSAFDIATSYSQSLDLDFGFCSTAGCNPGEIYAIGDTVWTDLNTNGIQDGAEPGSASIAVQLLDSATSTVLASTTTNASGRYAFDNLAVGTYKVRFAGLGSGETWTTQASGSDRTIDSDPLPATGLTPTITIAAGGASLRATTLTDLTSRATKIDPTIDAGRVLASVVAGVTICIG
jgi:choice-of-anchor A domain-containing protein